ncbi:MAG: hypothetical protein FJZ01_05710 [Candidatus Sericytochromatia bacterium]|nr:hypothetical protein [Candidatus Tanganyikabacteria bacterium]
MQRQSSKVLAIAVALALSGCNLLPFLGGNPPKTVAAAGDDAPATPKPTALPGDVTTAPPTPPPAGALKAAALGFLVSNNAAGLGGTVKGPAALVSNNAAGLVSNNAAGLVSNNAAGLVSNNAAGLVSNNAAGFRASALAEDAVKYGFVYLTSPDERFWVNDENKLIGTVTDAAGKFDLPKAPRELDVIVNVMLTDNRRLTALVNTASEASPSVTVNLASTLATEFLRGKAREFEFALKDVFATSETTASWVKIVSLTGTFLDREGIAKFSASDLAINNIPVLRQRYAVLLGTGTDKSLSDEWVNLIRLVKKPTTLPDWVARPLAITTVDTKGKIPEGDRVMAVAVAPAEAPNKGNLFVLHVNDNQTRVTEFPAGSGAPRTHIDVPGKGVWEVPGTMVALKTGEVVIMDSGKQWIALLNPLPTANPQADGEGGSFLDIFDPAKWKNPRLLVDVYTGAGDEMGPFTSVDDVAFDDKENPDIFMVDLTRATVRSKGMALAGGADATAPLSILAGKKDGVFEGTVVPTTVDQVVFNQPSKLTFHANGGKRWLYVTDNGDHIIVRIDLGSGVVEHVVGELPPPVPGAPRKALCYGAQAAEKGLYGIKTRDAHLRFPHKVLFDKANRMLLADSDNRLIRIATVYDTTPLIWTLAGLPQQTNDRCEAVGLPPPYSFQDGEARQVSLNEVNGMALDTDGNLILSDVREPRVRKVWTSFIK